MFADLSTNISDLLHHPGKAFPSVLAMVLLATSGVDPLTPGAGTDRRQGEAASATFEFVGTPGLSGGPGERGGAGSHLILHRLQLDGMHGWWLFAHMFGAGALVGRATLAGHQLGRAEPVWAAAGRRKRKRRLRRGSSGSPS